MTQRATQDKPKMTQNQQQDTVNVISHFSHPGHELVKRHYTGPFRCDMCWKDLSGAAYSCRAGCDFAIHDSCAGYSQTFSSPEHHAHTLVLVQTRHDATHICDVCVGLSAPGSFLYRCPPCGFDMHPACALLPQVVRSAWHPVHDLTLVVVDGRCASCNAGPGRGSYYRCSACNIDFHVSCAAHNNNNNNNNNAHQASSQDQISIGNALEIARIRVQGANAVAELSGPYYPRSRRDYLI